MKKTFFILGMSALVWQLSGCGQSDASQAENLGRLYLSNPSATIPPQCYTKTEDAKGVVSNPCYVCHTASKEPNFTNDLDLQLAYDFARPATVNRWDNLFVDRSEAREAISDEAILAYVRTDNYQSGGAVLLAETLTGKLPAHWDGDGNGRWDGYVPDVSYRFDEHGFDLDAEGKPTGWRALAYTPFPGTFFPTNGSADDVLIRLDSPYRQNEKGEPDMRVYRLNLAIVESLIKRESVAIEAVAEAEYGVDLNRNGVLDRAAEVVFDWAPLEGRDMEYVGLARVAQQQGAAPLSAGAYPLGTEFVHSVRYLDIADDGEVVMAPRMKELRYSRKTRWLTYFQHRELADDELKDAHDFPDRMEPVIGDIERGVGNRRGWRFSGFIEDNQGELRPQSYEELATCAGCHGAVGALTDSTYTMERKLDASQGFQRGWYHWNQKSLGGIPEPQREDGRGEYAFYLEQVGGADEYRSNQEVRERFFDEEGSLRPAMLAQLEGDISALVVPSARRALELNKAYLSVVGEQSYIRGRDAVLAPMVNVHKEVEAGQRTAITEPVTYR
ncbi:hypothetical protein [Alcanivorax sp.]|uniref:hypothetical protein n=1 Tax=Alcanivorax sp. TaxID=1872427 RepID=UPI002B27946C|nr:hypothetical protein [Alcanivorax sp.]